ncbi:MAG TPA: hypothetical protein VE172_08015 [Stackebrandtia sp.]|jgi:hypothetical protein|uniref:hypothetical protein n=1 Tax=Stackebrandtia sp. TaxID=2023065 RepID=UPI002D634502|nr:hypothetical protein [Stackebrandtia sp.]HZE38744.1 hypothetical protein [Stackebrandtia sp.]
MSLPAPVLDLAATVIPDAEGRGDLAFAYAFGAPISGFGRDAEIGLACVWNDPTVPDRAPSDAEHLTQNRFDAMLRELATVDEMSDVAALPLTHIANFAYGVLLSDDAGAGTVARGMVWDFPPALETFAVQVLKTDRAELPARLAAADDPWERADLLSGAVSRAYVAWFAMHERYFPGRPRRREYADHFGFDAAVPNLEAEIWTAADAASARDRYVAFADRVLADD